MRKTILVTLFLFIFILSNVLAVGIWVQEGNTDLTLPGGTGDILFASNIANLIDQANISYDKCNINPSLYTPIANDFDGDGFNDVVLSRNTGIEVFNTNCEVIEKITTSAAIATPPVLMNTDTDDDQEIVFAVSQQAYAYEYNGSDFVLLHNITIDDTLFVPTMMACSRDVHKCTFFDSGNKSTVMIDFVASTATLNRDTLNNTAAAHTGYSGLSMSDTFEQVDIYTSFCYMEEQGSTAGHSTCQLIDEDGIDANVAFNIDWTVQNWGVGRYNYLSSNIVKIGSVYRIVSQAWVDTATDGWGINVNDLSGTELLALTETDNDLRYGTVMVGDYDKDGNNELCTPVTTGTVNPGFILNCYDDSMTLKLSHQFLIANTTSGMVMADFLPDHNFLGIATMEGIWYINETNITHGILEYETGDHYVQASHDGSMIVLPSSGTSPMYVYTDDDEGFIVRDTFVGISCGDGICQSFETDFSCSLDCAPTGAEECISDSDCVSAYPYCISNLCVASTNITKTCSQDTDCDFTNPICYENVCISGFMSGTPSSGVADPIGQATDDAFDSTIGTLFGAGTMFKFLVAIALIIAIMVMVSQHTQAPVVIGISGLLMTIFVTVAGLMPMYVLILIIISAIGFATLKIFTTPGGG